MRRSRVQGLTNLGSISEIVCFVASSNHAKFHAFITKVNNSAIFLDDNSCTIGQFFSDSSYTLHADSRDLSRFFFFATLMYSFVCTVDL